MNPATLEGKDNATEQTLYMAMELSNKTWRLVFGDGAKRRHVTVEAGNLVRLSAEVSKARARFCLRPDVRMVSCYEAGRDGFWLHRYLESVGITNRVVDAGSIQTPRRSRRVKTDRIDGDKLLTMLIRTYQGERGVWSVVHVPSPADEDARRLHRERERLLRERTAHRNRLQGLLVTQGIRLAPGRDFLACLAQVRLWNGRRLPPALKSELEREYARVQLVEHQLRLLAATQREALKQANTKRLRQVAQLMTLGAIGQTSAWVFVMEFFGWRDFRNRRELAALAGLTGTPYASGESHREQGISKAGNRRVRTLLIEIAWLWLRYQPQSRLSLWYQARWAHGNKRMRRVGIVALARRLLIALWRYLQDGLVPEGAVLKVV
jgi:transposase